MLLANMNTLLATKKRAVRDDLVPLFLKELSDREESGAEGPGPGRRDLTQLLLREALASRVSDIHLEPRSTGLRVRFRIDGVVWDVAQLSTAQAKLVSNQFKAMAQLDPITPFTPRDSHATATIDDIKLDLRLSLAPCLNGETISLRLLNNQRIERSIRDLGLSAVNQDRLEDWMEQSTGMFLAAGPTSSGKTTTVYALLHAMKYADRRIISFEDPIEYEIDGITQIQLDARHQLDFAEGVKSMLRLDPDYLMLGEIRDANSAHSAVNAAVSGRVLLSTIHARDAIGAVTALRNWGLGDHEIVESLTVVVAQRLVRKLCPHCRDRATPGEKELSWLKTIQAPVPRRTWFSKGCEKCRGLGYFGRTGVFEFWRLDTRDYDLIVTHSTEHELRRHLADLGHVSLLEDGLAKVQDGTTSLSEIRRMGATGVAWRESATITK